MNIKNKKAFTIIELIVVIAVISILVMFGLPKLLGYVEKANLARIMHDIKAMEVIMEDELIKNEKENFNHFYQNGKKLGALILQNKLYEKEGYAKNIEYVFPDSNNLIANADNKNFTKMINELTEADISEIMGTGGPMITNYVTEVDEIEDPSFSYRIIPDEYRGKANSKLQGTFYVNTNGKVYYETDKPIKNNKPSNLVCESPLPDYEFEHITGKIVKYHGNAEHLIIPSHFLVNGECWPVRIIGKAAFMQGNFKSIKIPYTVNIIEDEAFFDGYLEYIYIPGSVQILGNNVFGNNNLQKIVYGGPLHYLQISGNNENIYYIQKNGNSVGIQYEIPTPTELGITYIPTRGGGGAIVEGSENYIPPYVKVNGQSRPVTQIATGAYQGLGLKTVILPETLEIIEDYAFAGNQLIGITIPNSVKHIGHYAFAFNEVQKIGDISGPDRKATIKSIILKEKEQIDKIDQYGDIVKNGFKLDIFPGENKGPNIDLMNQIWVTSIGNVVIDEEYVESDFDKHMRNLRIIQRAVNQYYVQYKEYPYKSDVPYSTAEAKEFSNVIINSNREITNFINAKNYYDIDFDKLITGIKDVDKYMYMIDNEGKVYYLSEITTKGLARKPRKIDSSGNVEGKTLFNVSFLGNEGTNKSKLTDLTGNEIEMELKNFNHNKDSGWTKEELKFDGVNDYVLVPTKYMKHYKPKEQITIIIRAHKDDWKTNKLEKLASTTQLGGWAIGANAEFDGYKKSNLLALINTQGQNTNYSAVGVPLKELSSWHTFVFTYDRRFGKFYVDGKLYGTKDEGQYKEIIYNPNNAMLIGAEVDGGSGLDANPQHFKGTISHMMIYDHALTPAEVQAITNQINK